MNGKKLTLDEIVELGFKEYPMSMEYVAYEEGGDDEVYIVHAVRRSFILGYLAGYGLKHSPREVNEAIDRMYLKMNKR